jgi:hypothetical protein
VLARRARRHRENDAEGPPRETRVRIAPLTAETEDVPAVQIEQVTLFGVTLRGSGTTNVAPPSPRQVVSDQRRQSLGTCERARRMAARAAMARGTVTAGSTV